MSEIISSNSPSVSSVVARPKPYFPALTGVRALAAYVVYFFHFNPFSATGGPVETVLRAFVDKFNGLGVAAFFVLSGFLIAVRYAENITWSWRWAARYLWKRFARIYPLYALLTCLTLLVFWQRPVYDTYGGWASYSNLDKALAPLLNLTLLRGFFEKFLYSGILQGWSLTVEECFYLSAPLLLLSSWRRPVALVLWPIGLAAIGVLLVAVFSRFPLYGGFFASYTLMIGSTFFGRSSEFITGIALAYYLKRQGPLVGVSWGQRIGGLVSLLLLLSWKVSFPADAVDATATSLLTLVINHLLLPLSLAWTFYSLLVERSFISRVLASRLFQLLGRSSYSFYLIHMGVLQILLNKYLTNNAFVLFVVLNIIAVFLFKWVEHPAQQWLTTAIRPAGLRVHQPQAPGQ